MKPKFKTLFMIVAMVALALLLVGCANTLMGEGGPKPADSIYGGWTPSGKSGEEDMALKLYASGNGTLGSKTFTWRVDPEATDPYKLIMVDPSGEATEVPFTYEDDALTLKGKINTRYTRDIHASSPADGTMPDFAVPEGEH